MEDTKKPQTTQGRAEAERPARTRKPEAIAGSEEAKQQAAVILEVMSGTRGAQEGAEALGISPMRYYSLEDRALQGMVKALEPRPKGRRTKSPEDVLKQVEKERDQMKREVGRLQTLLRMVRKSVHLQEPRWSTGGTGTKAGGKRLRKSPKRAEKLLARLKPAEAGPVGTPEAAC